MRIPRLPHPSMLLISSAILLLLCICALAKDEPKIKRKSFDTQPNNLVYFSASDTILVQERQRGIVWRSTDAGGSWDQIEDIEEGKAAEVWLHPYDNQVAYCLGTENTHWFTLDQGKTWDKFDLEDAYPSQGPPPLSFHAGDSKKALLHAQRCRSFGDCEILTYYTTNNFKDKKILRDDTRQCQFAHSTPRFQTSADDQDDRRILCIVKGKYSNYLEENRLLVSDDYFKTEHEPQLDDGRTVPGIISMAGVKGYIVTAAKAENTDELALYVTDDAKTWDHAEFPAEHKIKQEAYTILESTNHSIQVDVMTDAPRGFAGGMGVLFTSNSNGTYFTENIRNTNRGFRGFVDFEKVQDIQGIVIVNIVINPEQFLQNREDKKRVSRISFDDGRTWEPLKAGEEDLHLHSVTEMTNSGRVFSSAAPGIVMGVGNTGDSLKRYTEGDLYVSDDAGLTWTKARPEAHKYEFGDQGSVLLAVYDEEATDEIVYSINHGKDWTPQKLDQKSDERIKAQLLTTTPDSTSLKFVMIGYSGQGRKQKFYIYSIDFTSVHERKCGEDDFEDWWARQDKDGKPDCLMGHKQRYRRRKADADCFIDEEFKDPIPFMENCPCTDEDFECDYNFVRSDDRKECIPSRTLSAPEGQCKNPEDTYKGSSGWRLIAGNTCQRDGGNNKDDKIDRQCTDTVKTPPSGKIAHEIHTFQANSFREYYYLERTETSKGTDETVIARTDKGEVYLSHNHGKTWTRILEDEVILAIVPHQYFNDAIYFLTATKKVHYTINRGDTFGSFVVPGPPTQDLVPVLQFHPTNPDWFIWTSSENCGGSGGKDCHSNTHYSTDRGDHWETLVRYARRCEFIKKEVRKDDEKLVYCERRKEEKPDGEWELVSSSDWFGKSDKHFDDIIAFATMSEFIIVAARDTEDSLKVDASVDGKTFADAKFPPNFKVDHQRAYTVLDSSTHSVFLNVLVETRQDFEYGTIIKSNSNGTSYVLSINAVNRNTAGYVDFEKMLGLEGVAMVNVVGNLQDVEKGRRKKLRTMITHNDGGEWAPLRAPEKDAGDQKYSCDVKDLEVCSLHLHGFTERRDPRNAYSSPSAIGLMMGVGNVGEFLTEKADADTFITRDGGVTWSEVMKGNYMWDYGDQGSIIVIVEAGTATNRVFYSTDEGMNWTPYEFMQRSNKMIVESITSMPSDNSRNFLLWGKGMSSTGEIITINLDFTGLTDRLCKLDEENPEADDYYLWSPKHPSQGNDCLFGHVAQYHRKRTDRQCYNGKAIGHLHAKEKICECTRQDFECDYNFERVSDGSCQLVDGQEPLDHEKYCKDDPTLESYFEPSGYRKIPITDCKGGRELEFTTTEHPCPGHEKDFEEHHRGLSGFWLFVVAVLLPGAVASGVGYWVYRNWDGSFGRIRLGETGSAFDADRPWIQYPVAAVSAIVAVVAAVPLLVMSLWRSVMGLFGGSGRRYTTRQSFARGRGDYAVVDPDEDELLGGDDDAEEA